MIQDKEDATRWLFDTDQLPEFSFEERERIRKTAWFWQIKKKMKRYDETHQPPSSNVLLEIGREVYLRRYAGTVPQEQRKPTAELWSMHGRHLVSAKHWEKSRAIRKVYLRIYDNTCRFPEDSTLISLGKSRAKKMWRGWTVILC